MLFDDVDTISTDHNTLINWEKEREERRVWGGLEVKGHSQWIL